MNANFHCEPKNEHQECIGKMVQLIRMINPLKFKPSWGSSSILSRKLLPLGRTKPGERMKFLPGFSNYEYHEILF